MKRKFVLLTIVYLFILLFVYTSASKLLDYDTFKTELGKSPLLTAFAGPVAWGIPAIELLVAVMLAWPRFRLPALFASFSLMVMFTTYIIVILRYADYIPCSCGGVLENMDWGTHLVFNGVFVVLGAVGIMLQPMGGERG